MSFAEPSECESTGHERQVLTKQDEPTIDLPVGVSVADLVALRSAERPDAVAVVRGHDRLTYRDLDARANRLAWRLQDFGVGPDVVVGVCLSRGEALVVALLGVLRAGGAILPLDPDCPAARLAGMAADADVAVVVTEAGCPYVGGVGVLYLDDREEARLITVLPVIAPPISVRSSQLAYVIYTSGSSGRPKGVMIPHSALLNYLLWAARWYCDGMPGTAVLHSSIAVDFTITTLWVPLITGGSVTCVDAIASGSWSDPVTTDDTSLSFAKVTPGQLAMLSDQGYGPTSVSKVIVGGEQLLFDLLRSARAFLGNASVINEYGPTETVVGCVVHFTSVVSADSAGSVAIGRPISNMRVYVLDRELRPVPVGVRGELFIGGAGVARGYLRRPELTAERFVPDLFGPAGGRLYRTGDVVLWRADGELEFVGRQDQQVKIRGYRVEPGEIEEALRSHPHVRDAVVVVREDIPGDRRMAGYVTTARNATEVSGAEVCAWLRTMLPEYMVPTAVIVLGELPLSRNGKVDRSVLPDPGWRRLVTATQKPPEPDDLGNDLQCFTCRR